jgi:uncharacterized protein (TIGR00269 family)
MKCRQCGKQAVIALRAHNTALCSDDFIRYLENRVTRTIHKHRLIQPGDKPIVAVSGGKDSLSLWYMLERLGYPSDGIYIDLGIDLYSRTSFEKAKQMAKKLGRKLFRYSLSDSFEKGVEELSRTVRRPPCSLCGSMKRYLMNRICMDHGYNVLATGHNLDDEASALFGNVLYWKREYLGKKGVALEADEDHLARKVKPFFLCSEKEVGAYAVLEGIDYVYEECPYSVKAKTIMYKGVLNHMEEQSPGTKLQFVKGYLEIAWPGRDEAEASRTYCATCGYPSYGEACSFCRMTERFGRSQPLKAELFDPSDDAGDGPVSGGGA